MAVLLPGSVTIIVDIDDPALSILLWHVTVMHPWCFFAIHCFASNPSSLQKSFAQVLGPDNVTKVCQFCFWIIFIRAWSVPISSRTGPSLVLCPPVFFCTMLIQTNCNDLESHGDSLPAVSPIEGDASHMPNNGQCD